MSIIDLANQLELEDGIFPTEPDAPVPKEEFVRLLRALVHLGFPDKIDSLLMFDSFDTLVSKIFDDAITHDELEFVGGFQKSAWVDAFTRMTFFLSRNHEADDPMEEDDDEEDDDEDYVEVEEDEEDRLITYNDLLALNGKIDAIHLSLMASISVATIFTVIAIPGVAALTYYLATR